MSYSILNLHCKTVLQLLMISLLWNWKPIMALQRSIYLRE